MTHGNGHTHHGHAVHGDGAHEGDGHHVASHSGMGFPPIHTSAERAWL
jgi:hypothetical protein